MFAQNPVGLSQGVTIAASLIIGMKQGKYYKLESIHYAGTVEILTSGKLETAKSPEGRGRKSVSSPSLSFRGTKCRETETDHWRLIFDQGLRMIFLSPIS